MNVRVSKYTWLSGVLALVPALLTFSVANAQSTNERITNLESRLARLERLMQNSQANQTDMLTRLNELQTENQQLRNQLETLQFQSGKSGDRERQLYMDLDQRLQALEAGGGVAAAGAGATGGSNSVAGADEAAYKAAFALLGEGRYNEAGAAFTNFLNSYPDSVLRDNAQYWLAESYYVTKKFREALEAFQLVVTDYPQSRKLPDAWLKIGYCNFELARWDNARVALNTVARQYPDTTSGKMARERLDKMDASGL